MSCEVIKVMQAVAQQAAMLMRNTIQFYIFSCPGSSIPTLGKGRYRVARAARLAESVSDCHFRILTQIVTFET